MDPAYRIISLCPSNTELICALGLGDLLVGIDNYSDFPAERVAQLPRLGPDLDIDIEAVLALRPDLVVSSLSVPGMEKVVDGIQRSGLNQVVLSPHNFADIYADLQSLAEVVPESLLLADGPRSVIDALQSRVEHVEAWTRTHIPPANRPKLYWEWWPHPVFSPGRRNWLTELSRLAGAVNIFEDVDEDAVQDDGARVCAANPDWFLAAWTGIPQHKVPLQKIFARGDAWKNTTAFRKQRVLILSEGLFCRPSPRLVDGLEQLVGLLHPEAVKDLRLHSPAGYAPVRRANGSWLDASSLLFC